MQITELKLEQEVDINGHDYHYKGIQKRKIENMGKIECYIFASAKFPEKIFQRHQSSKLNIKNKEGKLVLCTSK